jgi:pimeloyl-ACP methyl ester carboxylesterase
VSTPRSLGLTDQVRPVKIHTPRGAFAALEAQPGTGVCERRPALLIPGFTGSKEDFISILQPLASAGRRVVAIDMRGQYQSQGAPDETGYAPAELAADVAAIGDVIAADGQGVHLVGHSLGGLIAREAALAREARIISLTLLSSGPGRITGQRAQILRGMLTIMATADRDASAAEDTAAKDTSSAEEGAAKDSAADDSAAKNDSAASRDGRAGLTDRASPADERLRATVAKIWDEHLGPQAKADGVPDSMIAFLHERMMGNSPTGLVAMGKYLLACPDRTTQLASLDGPPILVLYGENDDAWRPAVQERMARRLSASRVCIPCAGHSPAVEAPETTASTLTAFWKTAENRERQRVVQAARGGQSDRAWPAAAPGSATGAKASA